MLKTPPNRRNDRVARGLGHDPRLRQPIESVNRAPALVPTLADWVHKCGTTESTLAKLFRAEFGTTFGCWRVGLMIERAKQRLAAGHSVKAVAQELGYQRCEAFSKCFYASTGVWPSRWRKE